MSEIHDIEHFKKNVKACIAVFVILLVLTIVTVLVSRIQFGGAGHHAMNITVALFIAIIKAALVAAYFMHLNSEKSAIYRVLLFTGVFFAGLMFLTLWSYHDGIKFS